MYLSGVSFHVLGDHFLIHQSHAYEEAARKSEVYPRDTLLSHPSLTRRSASTTGRYTRTLKRKRV
jgi:hypothetical protein